MYTQDRQFRSARPEEVQFVKGVSLSVAMVRERLGFGERVFRVLAG